VRTPAVQVVRGQQAFVSLAGDDRADLVLVEPSPGTSVAARPPAAPAMPPADKTLDPGSSATGWASALAIADSAVRSTRVV
jgi:hypothetical protein